MAEWQSWLVDENEMDHVPVRQSAISTTCIQALFDFKCSHWVDMFVKSSIHSFDEELQLYEMLDLDVDREQDIDVDVDDDTGDILMG
jgi:hypothetical protein